MDKFCSYAAVMELPWSLHPQLAADTVPVRDLPLCAALLNDDANYPWLILVPRRADIVEIVDLDDGDRVQLMREIALASRALKAVTACHKLNVAALGNAVPQLHVHVIARQTTDAAWPHPVWGRVPRKPHEAAARDRLVVELRNKLA
ncbi:MAG: HIT domain-containing protein [Pseudolabrys sp.]|nr:HIT domain-containing protein [Pseudolabrys sp.]